MKDALAKALRILGGPIDNAPWPGVTPGAPGLPKKTHPPEEACEDCGEPTPAGEQPCIECKYVNDEFREKNQNEWDDWLP